MSEVTPSGNTAEEVREVFNRAPANLPYIIDGHRHEPTPDAAVQDARLKNCGLVHYDNQLTSRRWVAPQGLRWDGNERIKVTPLYMIAPSPGLEIEASDGEKYILPKDFKGDWISIVSPKGRRLIP